MGNQALNSDLKQVQHLDFDPKKLDPLFAKLWSFDELDGMRYRHIDSSIVSVSDSTLAG